MDRFIQGFRRFHETYYRENRALYDALASRGQAPRAMVVGCSDSRVDPQLIFGAAPGEMFVVRNVANLVPPYAPNADYHGTSAALEFAVRTLRVEHVIILGHAQCGGIAALLREPSEMPRGDFVEDWMRIAAPARGRALAAAAKPEDAQHLCEHESIKVSLDNLMTFPWVRERVGQGQLALHGWYYDLSAGDLLVLSESGAFEPALPARGGKPRAAS